MNIKRQQCKRFSDFFLLLWVDLQFPSFLGLSADLLDVEIQLGSLKDVTISTTRLPWAGRDTSCNETESNNVEMSIIMHS